MKLPQSRTTLLGSYLQGNPQIRLFKKLKRLKEPLKKLNQKYYGNISTKVQNARHLLELAQLKAMEEVNNALAFQLEKNALEEYIRLSCFEESFLKEKARTRWMKEGDKNSHFFHRSVKAHIARNKILWLQDENGSWTSDYEEVKILTVNFFENLFKEPNPTQSQIGNWLAKYSMMSTPWPCLRKSLRKR